MFCQNQIDIVTVWDYRKGCIMSGNYGLFTAQETICQAMDTYANIVSLKTFIVVSVLDFAIK